MNLTEIERLLSDGNLAEKARPRDESFPSLAAAALASARMGRFPEGREFIERLVPSDPDERMTALVLSASLRQLEGKHREALEILDSASLPEGVSAAAVAPFFLLRAELLQLMGMNAESIEMFAAALESAGASGSDGIALSALEGMVLAFRATYDEAKGLRSGERLLEFARSLAASSPAPLLLARCAEQIALLGAVEEAEPLFAKSLEAARSGALKWEEANIRQIWGRFEEYCCRYAEALEHTSAAVKLFDEMNALPALLGAMEQLAAQLANQARYDEAMTVLDRIRTQAEEISDLHFVFSSLTQSAWLAWEMDDPPLALEITADLLARCSEHDVRPASVVDLVREAFMRAPREMIREKLGDFAAADEFDE